MASLGPAPDPVTVLRAHRSAVSALAFHVSTGYLLSGDLSGELKIWDLVRRKVISSSRVHHPASGVTAIGTSKSLGNRVLSQGRDGTVKCWQLSEASLSREPILSIKTESYHFCKLSIPKVPCQKGQSNNSIDSTAGVAGGAGDLICIAGHEPTMIEVWDAGNGKRVEQLMQVNLDSWGNSSPSTAGMCMALQSFQPEGGFLNIVAGYEDGSMAVWDLRNAKVPLMNNKLHSEPVLSIAMEESCDGGVSGSADDKTVFFSIDFSERKYGVKKEVVLGKPGISDIAIRKDDKIVATAGWDHRVRIYDYQRRKPLAILKYHSASVTGVIFSEDMKLLASCSSDTSIALWSVYAPA